METPDLVEDRPDLVGDGFDIEPLMRAEHVAKVLDVPAKHVYEVAGLPRVRISRGRVRWRPEDVRAFIERRLERP
jgi:predicted DNA-binding transcriptional regulator AlpA